MSELRDLSKSGLESFFTDVLLPIANEKAAAKR